MDDFTFYLNLFITRMAKTAIEEAARALNAKEAEEWFFLTEEILQTRKRLQAKRQAYINVDRTLRSVSVEGV
jgi:hypothetical protein